MPEPFALQACRLDRGERFSWRESGSGPPLVMLHGWSMSSVVFTEVAALLGKNFRVLCPDLPGHGGSDPVAQCSLAAFAEQVERWMRVLDPGESAVLGWSLGGQVALQLAQRSVQPLSRLLLVATTPRFCQADDWPHGLPQTQLRALARNLERAAEKTLGDFFNLQFAGEDLPRQRYREILRFAVRPSPLPDAEHAGAALTVLGQTDLRRGLDAITLPTQILHGEADRIIPVQAGHYLAEKIPAAQIHTFAHVGHAPFLSCPQQAVHLWRGFLQ